MAAADAGHPREGGQPLPARRDPAGHRRRQRRGQPRHRPGQCRSRREDLTVLVRTGRGACPLVALPAPAGRSRVPRILVCGDVINDVLVKPLDGVTPDSDTRATISARPGGAAANQAAWMAHLGADVIFAGRVGARDVAYHRRELARAGVRARLAADRRGRDRLDRDHGGTGRRADHVHRPGRQPAASPRRRAGPAARRRGGAAPDRVHVLRAAAARRGPLAARRGPGPGARRDHRPGFGRLPGPDGAGRVPALDRRRRGLLPQP